MAFTAIAVVPAFFLPRGRMDEPEPEPESDRVAGAESAEEPARRPDGAPAEALGVIPGKGTW